MSREEPEEFKEEVKKPNKLERKKEPEKKEELPTQEHVLATITYTSILFLGLTTLISNPNYNQAYNPAIKLLLLSTIFSITWVVINFLYLTFRVYLGYNEKIFIHKLRTSFAYTSILLFLIALFVLEELVFKVSYLVSIFENISFLAFIISGIVLAFAFVFIHYVFRFFKKK